jgi:hypothetical protein
VVCAACGSRDDIFRYTLGCTHGTYQAAADTFSSRVCAHIKMLNTRQPKLYFYFIYPSQAAPKRGRSVCCVKNVASKPKNLKIFRPARQVVLPAAYFFLTHLKREESAFIIILLKRAR